MKETIKDLLERRSCRDFESRQVDPEALETILKAGTYAPTGKGGQSPLIVVVQDPDKVRAIEKINGDVAGRTGTFYGAPTVVIVFGDTSVPFCVADANLVLGNILNAAWAVGVDSCYIWRARECFETEEGKKMKKEWGIPDNYVGIGNAILGYGKEGSIKPPIPRKEGYVIRG